MMNDTVGRKGVDEETFLREMRIKAVEDYKQELVEVLQERIDGLEVESTREKSTNRELGIIRGMINSKSLIQSHVIKVK